MRKTVSRILLFAVFIIFNNQIISFSAEEYENIPIPCEVKECNPKWGHTTTVWYKGDKNKPAIMYFGGGASTFTVLDYTSVEISPLKVIMYLLL